MLKCKIVNGRPRQTAIGNSNDSSDLKNTCSLYCHICLSPQQRSNPFAPWTVNFKILERGSMCYGNSNSVLIGCTCSSTKIV